MIAYFLSGEGADGLGCVRFGMVTEDTDLEELLSLVLATGKDIETSSKFLEQMTQVVKKGREKTGYIKILDVRVATLVTYISRVRNL